ERCLGGEIVAMMTFGGSPMGGQTPPEWRNKIMHARLMIGDEVLMGSDAPPERYEGAKGFSANDQHRKSGRRRAHISRSGAKRDGADADPGDLLGHPFRHAGRSIRHSLDDKLREADLMVRD